MVSGVYQIKNQINGKRYVGSAVNLQDRWVVHLSTLRHNTHHNRHLQAAYDKYGEVVLTFSVLEYIEPEQLIEREQHYLDVMKPEYNMSPTAGSCLGRPCLTETRVKISRSWTPERRQAQSDRMRGMRGEWNPMYGKHHSEEHKRKISEALKGKQVSDETRRKYSEMQRGERNHHYGKHLSAEHRRKISDALTGRQRSEETKRKISKGCMGRRHSEETRRKFSGERNHNYGKHASKETRLKLSLALKAYWRRVRAAGRSGGMSEVLFRFLAILLAHLLYDFHWQGAFIAEMKAKSWFLLGVHSLTWALLLGVVLWHVGGLHWTTIPFLAITHFEIDNWKSRYTKLPPLGFALWVDQALHLFTMLIVAVVR